jgi:hypothetical protein
MARKSSNIQEVYYRSGIRAAFWELVQMVRNIREEMDQLYEKMNCSNGLGEEDYGDDDGEESGTTHERQFIK